MSTSSIFLGNSAYSNDFAQVIERTLAIAELPILQVEQQKAKLSSQSSAISDLQGKFESLRLALKDLASGVDSANLEATFSSTGIATATLGSAASAGSFSLEVSDLGSYTSYLSGLGVGDPTTAGLGTETTKTLIVDGVETTITLSANTLDALAKAINESGTGITANVINVSSTSTPNFKLVLQGNKLGSQTIELKDGDVLGADLLNGSALSVGSNAQYKVNGVAVSAESRNVTLAPDVSVTLTATTNSSGPVSLVVKRSATRVIEALRSVAARYNEASAKLDEHRGQGGGSLKGQSAIGTLSGVLRSLTQYTGGSGTFRNFTDLGLTFNDQGQLSLDSNSLAGISDTKLDELIAFLGSESGNGFVGAALHSVAVATDSESGILASEKKSYTSQIKSDETQLAQMRDRLDLMETNLRERFAAMDSAIAALQQQASYFNSLFESMRIAQQTYSK